MPLWLPGNRLVLPNRKRDYQRRVLATRPYSLVGYWPLDDLVGSVARNLAARATELLANAGFEVAGAGGNDVFSDWTETHTGGAVADETSLVKTGSHAAKISNTVAGTANVNQTFQVEPGRYYTFSFWTRGDGSVAGQYRIVDVTNNVDIVATTSTGVSGITYTQVTTTVQIPATCLSARLLLYAPATAGDAYFDDASVSRDLSGAYTGVALTDRLGPFNRPVPFFDGTGDYVNIYTAPLINEFSGAEGTLAGWVRVNSIADWTDGVQRYLAVLRVDTNNRLYAAKSSVNNQWIFTYIAGGTVSTLSGGSDAPLGWTHLALSWSAAADQMKAYVNGVQFGATQTVLGVWAGTLGSTTTVVGALDTTPASVWNGWLGDVGIWKVPLTQAEIAPLGRRR